MSLITDISRQAAKAAHTLALLDTETKNKVLRRYALFTAIARFNC